MTEGFWSGRLCFLLALKEERKVLLVQGTPSENYRIDLFFENVHRKFEHGTVVSDSKIKPTKVHFQFFPDKFTDFELVLTNLKTNVIVRLPKKGYSSLEIVS